MCSVHIIRSLHNGKGVGTCQWTAVHLRAAATGRVKCHIDAYKDRTIIVRTVFVSFTPSSSTRLDKHDSVRTPTYGKGGDIVTNIASKAFACFEGRQQVRRYGGVVRRMRLGRVHAWRVDGFVPLFLCLQWKGREDAWHYAGHVVCPVCCETTNCRREAASLCREREDSRKSAQNVD